MEVLRENGERERKGKELGSKAIEIETEKDQDLPVALSLL